MLKENNIYKFKLAITNFNWNLLNYDNEMCINDTLKIVVKIFLFYIIKLVH